VRGIFITVLFISATLVLACRIETRNSLDACRHEAGLSLDENTMDDWRRTPQGWERRANWGEQTRILNPRYDVANVHPFLPSALLVLVGIAALMAFDKNGDGRKTSGAATPAMTTHWDPRMRRTASAS
jgi:hypothetical protein